MLSHISATSALTDRGVLKALQSRCHTNAVLQESTARQRQSPMRDAAMSVTMVRIRVSVAQPIKLAKAVQLDAMGQLLA